MLPSRRHLPATQQLISFEATARHLSFSAAAQELSLTQGAISRHIKALENQLGVQLFIRSGKTISLTEAGQRYHPQIQTALRQITLASMNVSLNPQGGALKLAILPTFGTRWLAPRLPDFLSQNPGITVHLTTRLEPFDFNGEDLHAAIHFGQDDWPNTHAQHLMNEEVLPVCAPDYRQSATINGNRLDLQNDTLLHLETRPKAWAQWAKHYGVQIPSEKSGLIFDQFATMANAARSGAGIALLPRFLIEPELTEGSLVPVIDKPILSQGSYFLVWPDLANDYPPLRVFKSWLKNICENGG